MILLFSILVVPILLVTLLSSSVFFSSSRFTSIISTVTSSYTSSLPNLHSSLSFLLYLFIILITMSNVPFFTSPFILYSFILFFSLILWVPIIAYALYCHLSSFISHLLPYGSPLALMLFLPLVEIFSQVIRPLTLTIRFATNLSAGHIMMFMFSFFVTLSSPLSPVLYVVLFVLLAMEIMVAFLQIYIFYRLLGLYVSETMEL